MGRKILYLTICMCYVFFGCFKNEDIEIDTTKKQEVKNPYFTVLQNEDKVFHGSVFFDSFGDITVPKCNFEVECLKIANLKKGTLYQIKIHNDTKYVIPEKRLTMGYFYVQQDKIVRIWENENEPWNISEECINKLKKYDSVPKYSVVVCQNANVEDCLNEGEEGWHYYLESTGDECTSHLWYQYPQHSGYWESFKWKKNKGLISYRSGFRDGVNYIRLKRKLK